MNDESLTTLLRLRQAAVDEARLALAACVREEAAAREALDALDAAADREAAAAARLEAPDRAVEEFATWLRRNRIDRETREQVLILAETRSREARSVLTVSMAAARSLEKLVERRVSERRAQAEARSQRELDEQGTRR